MIAIQDGHIPKRQEVFADSDLTDDLLAPVPVEIVEAIGRENVQKLEEMELQIGWAEGVLSSENPFGNRGASEIDLSFLPRTAAYKLETYSSARHKGYAPLERKISDISILASRTANKSMERKNKAYDRIKELGYREDLDVAEAVMELRNIAPLLPTQSTLKTMQNMLKCTADHAQTIDRVELEPTDADAPVQERATCDEMLEWGQAVANSVEHVRSIGRSNYDALMVTLQGAQINFAIETLKTLDQVGDNLIAEIAQTAGGDEEFVVRDMFSLKDYLLAKAQTSKDVLLTKAPEMLEDPEVAALLQRFNPNGQEAPAEDKPWSRESRRGFMRHHANTLNARDILKGGQRLLTKKDKGSSLEKMAKGLLESRKRYDLNYAEIGFLVAAAKSKKVAEEFIRTWKIAVDIQANGVRSQAVHEVVAAHPSVFLELSQLDPRQMVQNIASALRNADDQLMKLVDKHHEDFEELFVDGLILPADLRQD